MWSALLQWSLKNQEPLPPDAPVPKPLSKADRKFLEDALGLNEFEQMKVAVQCIQNRFSPFADKLQALENLVDLLESIDNACDLHKIRGSYDVMHALLNGRTPTEPTGFQATCASEDQSPPTEPTVLTPEEHEELRALAARALATTAQNNPDIQDKFAEEGFVAELTEVLKNPAIPQSGRYQALAALSCPPPCLSTLPPAPPFRWVLVLHALLDPPLPPAPPFRGILIFPSHSHVIPSLIPACLDQCVPAGRIFLEHHGFEGVRDAICSDGPVANMGFAPHCSPSSPLRYQCAWDAADERSVRKALFLVLKLLQYERLHLTDKHQERFAPMGGARQRQPGLDEALRSLKGPLASATAGSIPLRGARGAAAPTATTSSVAVAPAALGPPKPTGICMCGRLTRLVWLPCPSCIAPAIGTDVLPALAPLIARLREAEQTNQGRLRRLVAPGGTLAEWDMRPSVAFAHTIEMVRRPCLVYTRVSQSASGNTDTSTSARTHSHACQSPLFRPPRVQLAQLLEECVLHPPLATSPALPPSLAALQQALPLVKQHSALSAVAAGRAEQEHITDAPGLPSQADLAGVEQTRRTIEAAVGRVFAALQPSSS
ncbi:hypothetical protein PAPYR_10840 [Paratrimastix pyriformis]|uniref:Nucleotide exchange factor Fes1 domain-containing protein n=1 Tax=Paratrimastix pyriformis TaxID=342808 RepID=A0ABQ8U518_9EUKA|nr:hypothetical protein PAPYR_10840 [Paratrimastix pyriformis]